MNLPALTGVVSCSRGERRRLISPSLRTEYYTRKIRSLTCDKICLMLVFACFSPHPPILLPTVGSPADRAQVKKTLDSLEKLGRELAKIKPDLIIVFSPHPDWGIEVPLYFLNSKIKSQESKLQFKMQNYLLADELWNPDKENLIRNLMKSDIRNYAVFPILTSLDSPRSHFEFGKRIASMIPKKRRVAWIASGDMSHRLKEDGPYGLHPSGPKFDQKFIELLEKKDVEGILNLNPKLVEEAGECGLRSFCMLLGALEGTEIDWQPEILSYEGPFGVGYLVAGIRIYPN